MCHHRLPRLSGGRLDAAAAPLQQWRCVCWWTNERCPSLELMLEHVVVVGERMKARAAKCGGVDGVQLCRIDDHDESCGDRAAAYVGVCSLVVDDAEGRYLRSSFFKGLMLEPIVLCGRRRRLGDGAEMLNGARIAIHEREKTIFHRTTDPPSVRTVGSGLRCWPAIMWR